MPFINDLISYKSVSVVGLEKNTGKTETLNYILKRLSNYDGVVGVTSIGIDGEGVDQVTQTAKPEIYLPAGTLFTTSEGHYTTKKLTSEILNVSQRRTSLGRLVTARVKIGGKVLLSGPADTVGIKSVLADYELLGARLSIVDGALSRMSLASPSVTDAMVLATGAAYSMNVNQLIKQTKFICDLISINAIQGDLREALFSLENGVWGIKGETLVNLYIPSVLLFERYKKELLSGEYDYYVGGVVTDKLLDFFRLQRLRYRIRIVVRDFTRLFVTPSVYSNFVKSVGDIAVLEKTNLVAVTVNPVSPQGYVLDSKVLTETLTAELGLPVYNIREL